MQTFRRAEGERFPDFMNERMQESKKTGSGKKVMVMLDRVEVPPHIAKAATTPELQAQAGGMAARASVSNFFQCVDMVMANKQQHESVGAIRMGYVGLRCEGRGGCYDLLFFPHSREVYAVHVEDPDFVCKFVMPEQQQWGTGFPAGAAAASAQQQMRAQC